MSNLKYRRKPSSVIRKRANKKNKYGSRGNEFLRPEKTRIIFSAIEAGMPPRKAADLAGIPLKKYDEWMQRGRKNDPKYSRKCFDFRRKVLTLEKQRELEALEAIKIMGNGGYEITETKIKVVDGKQSEITTITKTLAPKWQAAAWYLERRCSDEGEYTLDQLDSRTPDERAKEIVDLVTAMRATIPSDLANQNT